MESNCLRCEERDLERRVRDRDIDMVIMLTLASCLFSVSLLLPNRLQKAFERYILIQIHYTLFIHYTDKLHRYPIQIHCADTLYRYIVQIHCTDTLYKYTIQIHYIDTLTILTSGLRNPKPLTHTDIHKQTYIPGRNTGLVTTNHP